MVPKLLRTSLEQALQFGCTDVHAVRLLIQSAQMAPRPATEVVEIGALRSYDRPVPSLQDYDQLRHRRCGRGGAAMSPNQDLQVASIRQYAKQLCLSTVGVQFERLAEEAIKQKQSHLSFLEALLEVEMDERERRAIQRRIQEAHFPVVKTLEEFDFESATQISAPLVRDLAEGGYLTRKEPVIFLGETGTGKSHLATGLAVTACQQRKRVRFSTVAEMVTELIEAKNQSELNRVRNRWTRYELIVLDEMGYVAMSEPAAELLFQVIAGRAERAAVIVTTNLLCGAPHKRFNAESVLMRRGL